MTLIEQIDKNYLEAYKSKDEAKTSLLRMVKSSIQNAEIANKTKLSDQDVIKLLQKEVKQRQDSAEEYNKGGRIDLANKETNEIELLKKYLPSDLSDQELELIIKSGITQVGATGPDDFGKVMGSIMPKISGRATGDRVSAALRELLK